MSRIAGGDRIPYLASSSAVAPGDVVVVGTLVAIAEERIPVGSLGMLSLRGEFSAVPRAPVFVDWPVGTVIYWDAGNGYATTSSSGNTRMGFVSEASPKNTPTLSVLLMP